VNSRSQTGAGESPYSFKNYLPMLQTQVSCQSCAPAALVPGKEPAITMGLTAGWAQVLNKIKKNLASARNRTPILRSSNLHLMPRREAA
jgi:hypothetical protein